MKNLDFEDESTNKQALDQKDKFDSKFADVATPEVAVEDIDLVPRQEQVDQGP